MIGFGNKILLFVFLVFLSLQVKANRFTVTHVCSKVQNKEHVLCLNSKTARIESNQIAAHTQVTKRHPMAAIIHIWRVNGKEVFRKQIATKNVAGFRAVTTVQLPGRDGTWEIEVQDDVGRTLEQIEFVTANGPVGYRARLLPHKTIHEEAIEPHLDQNKPVLPPSQASLERQASVPAIHGDWVAGLGILAQATRLEPTQKSNASTATFLSEVNYGFDMDLSYLWPEKRYFIRQGDQTKLLINMISNNFKSVVNKTIHGIPNTLIGFEVIHKKRNLFYRTDLLFGGGLQENFFDRASSSVDLNFSKLILPMITAGLEFRILEDSKLSSGVGVHFIEFLPAANSDYSVEASIAYRLQIFGRYLLSELEKKSISAVIDYQMNDQNTSLITRKQTQVGLALVYSWGL